MKICVIFNPRARGEKATRFRASLSALSQECSLRPTAAAGGGRALGSQAVDEGFEIVVAAGGDGTVNEVLNGICDRPASLDRVRFGVLPLGTVNVFASEVGIPARLSAAWEVITRGKEIIIDVPFAEYQTALGLERRAFVQMAGAGIDARAVEFVEWEHKKRWGQFAYWIAGTRALRHPQRSVISAITDEETIQGELVLVGNGRFYGGRYKVFPHADLQDGLLEVTIVPRVNFITAAWAGWGLLTGRLYNGGQIRHLKTRSVRLTGDLPTPFHLEGENVGHLPATFAIQQQTIRVLVP